MPEGELAAAVTATTEAYYDSDEADSFYAEIWGGEDIHIGIYQTPEEDVATASARTVFSHTCHIIPRRSGLFYSISKPSGTT